MSLWVFWTGPNVCQSLTSIFGYSRDMEMSKEQLIKYFQALFIYIGTKKKKDLVEVLLKLRGIFFFH